MPDRRDPMTDRLAKFTPTSGLDRDAILFAAGRRSAPGSWSWKAIVGLLVVAQVVTLCVLWPRDMPSVAPSATPQVTPVVRPAELAPSPPPDVWTASSTLDVVQAAPKSSPVEFVSSGPPLTVWSGHRFD